MAPMPIYEYRCASCGVEFEAFLPVGAATPACRACGTQDVERRMSRLAAVACDSGGGGT